MLNANAALIHLNLGTDKQGNFILTISEVQYNNVSTTPFVKPINPPSQALIPDKAATCERDNIAQIHKSDLYLCKQYNTIEKALSQQLLQVYDAMYMKPSRNRFIGYAAYYWTAVYCTYYGTLGFFPKWM